MSKLVALLLIALLPLSECFYKPEPLSKAESNLLNSMQAKISRMLPESFYNYYLMCSSENARVSLKSMLVHRSIPAKYHDTIVNTLHGSLNRKNKCPKWTTANIHRQPESGSMDELILDERTPVGQVVYLLSAIDPERQQLYYFIRRAENEPHTSDNLFSVNQIKIGENW